MTTPSIQCFPAATGCQRMPNNVRLTHFGGHAIGRPRAAIWLVLFELDGDHHGHCRVAAARVVRFFAPAADGSRASALVGQPRCPTISPDSPSGFPPCDRLDQLPQGGRPFWTKSRLRLTAAKGPLGHGAGQALLLDDDRRDLPCVVR